MEPLDQCTAVISMGVHNMWLGFYRCDSLRCAKEICDFLIAIQEEKIHAISDLCVFGSHWIGSTNR
jgi:hypothetical protein